MRLICPLFCLSAASGVILGSDSSFACLRMYEALGLCLSFVFIDFTGDSYDSVC